jgi:hypothetical protein
MSFTWTLEDQPDHLVVRVEGQWQIQSLFQMLDEIAARCREAGYARVLCDLREVRGPLAELSKYLAGARVAEVLKTVKIAALAGPQTMVTGFAAKVAASRGGRLFTTKSEDEARQWLFE